MPRIVAKGVEDLAEDPGTGELPGDDVLGSGLLVAPTWQRVLKRGVDLVGAALLLALTLPLIMVVAVLVASTSRGPILYRQARVGRNGEEFEFLKFRTMCRDSDAVRAKLAAKNEADGPIFKIRHDPRITPVGRVLRKLSLDELPQLLHVLDGTMSLVGPRPPMPNEVAEYGDRERMRLAVKPGLTCIWQVSGRSDIGFDEWVDLDLEYISRWTLGLDLRILAATVPAVVSGRGAY